MKPIQKLAAAVLLQGLALSAVAGLSVAQAVPGPGPEAQVAEEGADEVSASTSNSSSIARRRSGSLWQATSRKASSSSALHPAARSARRRASS